jgi:hypothetical protein
LARVGSVKQVAYIMISRTYKNSIDLQSAKKKHKLCKGEQRKETKSQTSTAATVLGMSITHLILSFKV